MLMLDAKYAVISSALARQMMAKLATKFDLEFGNLDFWAEMHPSQNVEWENCRMQTQSIMDAGVFEGDGRLRRMFMGLPLELNPHLSPSVVLIRKNREIVAEIGRLGMTKWDMEEVNAGN